ncbi:hypothetical protein UCDDS831_g02612 [Diplodia seriata]|uniref:Uncharacterized protein n=1 Tax=Diplodia seriata TaxID=420778 RepID=A0A0G2EPR1_9PEZI|nr:hypothetical protein UCDDS831_g02612 [Diplodia seriata]
MAPKYDASKVENLNDADKLRLISAYLNHNDPNNVNWDVAATDGGSKSKDSYKKMLATALKKLAPDTTAEGDDALPAPEPAPAPATKRGRKRTTPANEVEDDDGNAAEKAKKPRKPRAKKAMKVEDGEAA